MSEPYRAVLIDLYDTLAYSQWPWLKEEMAKLLGVTPKAVGDAMTVTRPRRSTGAFADVEGDTRNWLDVLHIEADDALVEQLVNMEVEAMRVGVILYEDSLPVVHDLRSRGIQTALVSNCSHSTRPVVDRLKLEEAFDAVVLSFEVGSRKPEPAIYLEALARLGLKRDDAPDCLMVDDQAEYCDGASAVGLQARLIIRPDATPDEGVSLDSRGHAVITSLTDIL
jgi:putative hydrolase of the HAD superfamily